MLQQVGANCVASFEDIGCHFQGCHWPAAATAEAVAALLPRICSDRMRCKDEGWQVKN